MSDVVISLRDVSILFNLSRDKVMSLKDYVVKALKKELFFDEFWALRDISLDVKKGEILGILGFNGAGKSTLLKIIAGVYKPTKGTVKVIGEVVPLIELGTGFDFEFSARENIFMNGAIFGHPQGYMENLYAEIMDFSELWDFADTPLKKFSSGMVARLAFATATSFKPQILIVDEILGVGDFKFQEKCKVRINEMFSGGTTVLMVSHSTAQIREMCTNAILLTHGQITATGTTTEVCDIYEAQ
jgi:ABC-type polysaccharide/polyol phosphate transport system ATPase subunit